MYLYYCDYCYYYHCIIIHTCIIVYTNIHTYSIIHRYIHDVHRYIHDPRTPAALRDIGAAAIPESAFPEGLQRLAAF